MRLSVNCILNLGRTNQSRRNYFLHHITTPDLSGKDETVLKKISEIYIPDIFFWNAILYYEFFLSRMGFSFLFSNFHFRNTIISFSDFFFEMYYFSIPDCFVRNRILIFVFRFLFPKLNNYFQIYFFGIYYFQF